MNQRFQELWRQVPIASDAINGLGMYCPYVPLQIVGEPVRYSFTQDQLKQYAELIVRDCMEAVDGYTKQRAYDTYYRAEEQIQALFGVDDDV